MKERGMIFNTEMVQAIQDGRKTVTRRPVKPQPKNVEYWLNGEPSHRGKGVAVYRDDTGAGFTERAFLDKCPYGQPGDRIYVRETWARIRDSGFAVSENSILYKANGDDISYEIGEESGKIKPKWRPSIHMPKKYARIWLEITDVRVERVQDITEEEAEKEGFESVDEQFGEGTYSIEEFMNSWKSFYADSWDRNDWVWVVEFKRINR